MCASEVCGVIEKSRSLNENMSFENILGADHS